MKFLTLRPTLDPNIIGGKTPESQIIGVESYSLKQVNQLLANRDFESIHELSNVVFKLRNTAKLTDVITGVMLNPGLWFVNIRFIELLNKYDIANYFIVPAILSARGAYHSDYYLFQFDAINEDAIINFKDSVFIVEYQFPFTRQNCIWQITNYSSYKYYQNLVQQDERFGKIIVVDLKFQENVHLDFLFTQSFGLGFLVSERFGECIKRINISGVKLDELERGPYYRLTGPDREPVATT